MDGTRHYDDGLGPAADDIVAEDQAARAFVEALVARGQAARAGSDGRLPAGTTHQIVGTCADGTPILRRRRMA